MIVFEEKLRELIGLMPDLNGTYPIRYDWGTVDVLNKYLTLPETVSKYPLIWLVTDSTKRDLLKSKVSRTTRLVIATMSNDVDGFNFQQYQTDYKYILLPTYENLIKLLNSSGVSKIIGNSIVEEMKPNYSFRDNGKGLIDVWNALVIDLDIELTEGCINQVKFTI